jgi:hypothetical protein
MGGQIQKAAVEGAVLTGQHLRYYRLQVVVDALPATATEVLKGPDMGIEYHLKAFTGIGDTERHPAIGQPEVGYPDSDRLPAKLHQFVAPVKLERFARVKGLRYVRGNLFAFITVAPFPDKALDAVIAACKPLTLQFFKEYLCCALFSLWFGAIRKKSL